MTPMIEIILYLSATFLLGLSLGAAIWKLGTAHKVGTVESEKAFWQQRVQQARAERDQDQEKIERLEAEREKLRDQLKQAGDVKAKKAS